MRKHVFSHDTVAVGDREVSPPNKAADILLHDR